jgi:hypothetical protein
MTCRRRGHEGEGELSKPSSTMAEFVVDFSMLNRHSLGVIQASRKELNLWDFYHKSANCNSSLFLLNESLRGFDIGPVAGDQYRIASF